MQSSITTTGSVPQAYTGNPFSESVAQSTRDHARTVQQLSNQVSRLSILTGLLCAALIAGASYCLALEPQAIRARTVVDTVSRALSSLFTSTRKRIASALGVKLSFQDAAESVAEVTAESTQEETTGEGGNPFEDALESESTSPSSGDLKSEEERSSDKATCKSFAPISTGRQDASQWIVQKDPNDVTKKKIQWTMTPLRPPIPNERRMT